MKTTLTTLAAIAMIWTTTAYAQEHCVDLLRLSRTSSRTVTSERRFQDAKLHFCDEYSRSRQEGRSANYGGSYEALSFSMGTSSTTEDNVASKYCRFEGDTRELEGSFEEYIEGIDPGAYRAYQTCVEASQEGVGIELMHVDSDRLDLLVSYVTSEGNAPAELTWRSSAPVTCLVDREGDDDSRQFTLELNERVTLGCSRENPRMEPVLQPDYVSVVRNNGNAAVNVSWPKYNEQGVRYETVDELQQRLDANVAALRAELQSIDSSLEAFRTLERLPLRQRVDGHPGFWGSWRQEFSCPARHYVCGLQQRIEGQQGGGGPDDTAMNGLRMFCCPLFATDSATSSSGSPR